MLILEKQFFNRRPMNKESVRLESNPRPLQLAENARIIKLIRQKKYPLHLGNRSTLLFPKIKEHYNKINSCETSQQQQGLKKYVEIQIKEEEQKLCRTDIEEELLHKYKNTIQCHSQIQSSHKNNLNVLLGNVVKTQPDETWANKPQIYKKQSQGEIMDNPNKQDYDCLKGFKTISLQAQKNEQLLVKIRQSLDAKKKHFLGKIKLSQGLQDNVNKENYSFQYLVNQFEQGRGKDMKKMNSVSAYDKISPNKLKQFMSLFTVKEKKKGNKFDHIQMENEKKPDEDKNVHGNRDSRRNIKIMEQECQISLQNLISAKLRMKSNHKRLIQLSKFKNK